MPGRGLRVLARSELQGARRGAREARRTVPRRRRPPERADDGRAPVRQHATGTPEPPLGAPRPLAVPLVDGQQGRRAHEGHEVARGRRARRQASSTRGRRGSSSTGSSAPGTKYWYQVTLVDQAGNESSKTIGMQPTAGIFAPADGAVVGEPPVVQWAPVAKARFYNLQLWRGNLQAAHDLGEEAEARAAAALVDEGRAPLARRRELPALRVARVRDDAGAALRQARRPGRLRRQAPLRPRRAPGRPWPLATGVGRSSQSRHKCHLVRHAPSL